MPHGSYSLSDIILYLKKHREKNYNPLIKIYVSNIKNSIKFKIKIGYYLEHLTPETMKLLRSNKSKILKIKMVKMCLI